jgi:hypothetical protein
LLYNNKGYGDSQRSLLDAIDILEKAQNHQLGCKPKIEEDKQEGFWTRLFNPFRCGKSD